MKARIFSTTYSMANLVADLAAVLTTRSMAGAPASVLEVQGSVGPSRHQLVGSKLFMQFEDGVVALIYDSTSNTISFVEQLNFDWGTMTGVAATTTTSSYGITSDGNFSSGSSLNGMEVVFWCSEIGVVLTVASNTTANGGGILGCLPAALDLGRRDGVATGKFVPTRGCSSTLVVDSLGSYCNPSKGYHNTGVNAIAAGAGGGLTFRSVSTNGCYNLGGVVSKPSSPIMLLASDGSVSLLRGRLMAVSGAALHGDTYTSSDGRAYSCLLRGAGSGSYSILGEVL